MSGKEGWPGGKRGNWVMWEENQEVGYVEMVFEQLLKVRYGNLMVEMKKETVKLVVRYAKTWTSTFIHPK